MFIRLLTVTANQENIPSVRELYSSAEVGAVLGKVDGLKFRYLLESEENPGELLSISVWDSKTNAEEYEQGGAYDELIDKFKHLLTSTPTVKSYKELYSQSHKSNSLPIEPVSTHQ